MSEVGCVASTAVFFKGYFLKARVLGICFLGGMLYRGEAKCLNNLFKHVFCTLLQGLKAIVSEIKLVMAKGLMRVNG